MFILLGVPDDPCLMAMANALAERGRDASILAHPFAERACGAWRYDNAGADIALSIDGKAVAIEGVLASRRSLPRITPSEQWSQQDLLYANAEGEAALLGWLWALPCPVIDRWPAWLWYHTRRPLLSWAPLLAQAGLPPLDCIVTSDAQELTRFMAAQGGAAIDPPAGGVRQLVGADEKAELALGARRTPVRLTGLHQGAWRACLAGNSLIWDDGTAPDADRLTPRLRAFAARVGLSFVEFIVTSDAAPRIVDVEPRVRYELFGPLARRAIADALAGALTATDNMRAAS
ncbi:hypothetical protein IC762_27975 [Bradyrhizobium genosp. L]|uniref:hypothetical protein n=1 Tax=Bradyrhizobium genosp. L TaxID=83637 RepID=UPI0018A2FFAC|nr:hypothetical protein [Bradyrhizobium genosp. L]QPF83512.1 hypothetical protein IC762_27975 [Bradyrhizobium genosp. L]